MSLQFNIFRPRSAAVLIASLFIGLSCVFQLFGGVMGHRATRSDLESHLSLHLPTDHLDFFFSRDTDLKAAAALTEDGEFSLSQVARYFGIVPHRRISVFVFKDADDKAASMGAGDTNVAKPWRSEVYVTLEAPPHDVLRHELVHAVSAEFAPGPFGTAGKWNGLIPNPALIEGLATAASGPRGDLTVHQWAAAMVALGLLPPIEKLTGLGFFDLTAAAAYTASGSFCDWFKNRFGANALMRAYGAGDFEAVTGRTLGSLESEWTAFLKTVPSFEADKAAARARFDKLPIIRTVCVHETARLCDEAAEQLVRRNFAAADELLAAAGERSRGALEIRDLMLYAANLKGDVGTVRTVARDMLRAANVGEARKSALTEMLLDLDMSRGILRNYAADYTRLAIGAETEDRRRQLEVKSHLARTGVSNRRIFDVFGISPGYRAVDLCAAALIVAEESAARPSDPVRTYLLARRYFVAESFDECLWTLSRAEAEGLEQAPFTVQTAAQMMKGESLLSLSKYDEATAVFRKIAGDPKVREGIRAEAADRADRARFLKVYRQRRQRPR